MKKALIILIFLIAPSLGFAGVKGVFTVLPGPMPKAGSLKQVVVHEFFAFHCPHCHHFHAELKALKKKFGKKLKVVYVPIDWAGPDPAKLYYIAQAKGKGMDVMDMLFDFIHEKGLGDSLYKDRFKLAYVAKLNGLMDEFKKDIDSPAITAQYNKGRELAQQKGVDSTPVLVVEGVLKATGNADNLTLIINSLLQKPVK